MATSSLGHYVRFGETALDSLDPVGTGMARRGLGNLNHVADQYAQRRVAWVSHGTTLDTDPNVIGTERYRLWTSHPFDLHVRSNGESYSCRLRLRVSSGHATNAATFYAALVPEGAGEAELYSSGANVGSITVAQTAYTWEAGAALLYLDSGLVREATRTVAAINEASGAEIAAVWLRAQLIVSVSVVVTTSVASLGGVQLDEYLAP